MAFMKTCAGIHRMNSSISIITDWGYDGIGVLNILVRHMVCEGLCIGGDRERERHLFIGKREGRVEINCVHIGFFNVN